MACLGEPGWDDQTVARVFFEIRNGISAIRIWTRSFGFRISALGFHRKEWRASTMKRLFCGFLGSALWFGAVGLARADLRHWTDYGCGDIQAGRLHRPRPVTTL